ncbi:MAG: amino acid permease [Pseudomonadota bacterium]
MVQHKKVLGVWRLTALVIGNMVGSGLFLLPASLAGVGSISLLAWIVTGIGAICIALVFARLASIMPKVGGPYAYCHDSLGNFMGFQTAYNYWIYIWVGNTAIVITFVGYLGYFFPALAHNHRLWFIVAATTVWLITLINIKGVREASIFQLVTVILKITPILLVAIIGLSYINVNNFHAFNISGHSTFGALNTAATLTLWAFTGVESATVPAADVKNPQRAIAVATILGTLISATLYILSTIVLMGIIPMRQLAQSSAPFSDAAKIIFGEKAAVVITIAALISTLGALNGWTLLQGQVPFAAAKDKLFHHAFTKETKNGSPYVALIISAILITLLLLLNSGSLVTVFDFMISLAIIATLFVYFFSCVAQIKLMVTNSACFSKKHISRDVIICLLAMSYIIWAIIGSGWKIIADGVLLFLTGIPIYIWIYLSHKKRFQS